ncbi:thioredoxin disulfide isomerase [Nonlabens tegetincola]|uniref:Thioredoxin disulfide isomerase n=1 Tax=Nonlabens tegetincola TaxID=323273 RepID=A0A090Q464_9FLAO|nr:thioredoxin family protein [Nonlabens tegetincola]GAK96503.1 thioredoxin disulfide isomerase [Nonlabens tegetincola]
MMKYFVLLLFLVATFGLIAQDENNTRYEVEIENQITVDSLDWYTDFDKALKHAGKSRKPMLVYFSGSDWCTPCKNLEQKFFNTPRFINESQNYILVYLDIPFRDDIVSPQEKKANKKLFEKYNNSRYPTLLALDHKGKEKNRIENFSGGDARYHWNFMAENEKIFRF